MKDNKVVVLLNTPSSARWASSPSRGEENNVRGFTLIELLVVVLIIGILAAVALPQYRVAVEKSRFTEAMTIVSSIQKEMDLYVLENGYPASTAYFLGNGNVAQGKLNIDVENIMDCSQNGGSMCGSRLFVYQAYCSSSGCHINVYRQQQGKWSNPIEYYVAMHKYTLNSLWEKTCIANARYPYAEKLCKNI